MTEQKRRFSLSHTAGTIGVIVVLNCVLWLDGMDLRAFLKLTPFLLVVGLPFCLLLAGFGRTFLEFIPDAFKTLFTTPINPNPKFAEIARSGGQYSIAAGVIGTVFGLIFMLSHLESAECMGPAIAMAFLALLYGVLASECVFGFLFRAYLEQTQEASRWSKKGVILSFCAVLMLLCAFFILMYSMSVVSSGFSHREQNTSHTTGSKIYVQLTPFTTNAGDPRADKMITFTPCLVVSEPALATSILSDPSPVRDRILRSVASLSMDELADNDGNEFLKKTIRRDLNIAFQHTMAGVVTDVLFVDFLIWSSEAERAQARLEGVIVD